MSPAPPTIPHRLLARALRDHRAGTTILGDLLEDYVRVARDRGGLRARLWYWREALPLAAGVATRRLVASYPTPRPADALEPDMSVTGLGHDLRYAFRAVRQDPGFLLLGVLIIGLGVGASTAVFSVLNPLLLRPLPFEAPERLVWIANTGTHPGLSAVTSRSGNLRDFRAMADSFDGLTGYNAFFEQNSYTLVHDGKPERLAGVDIAGDFLEVLGVEPALGRNFAPEESVWDGRPAIILTHAAWTRRFQADPSIVGDAITLNGEPREVVGVLPESFDFTSVFAPAARVDFVMPLPIGDETDRWGNAVVMVGRLRDGATVESAQAELDSIVTALQQQQPDRWGLGAAVHDLQSRVAGPYRSGMLMLAAAAGVVILIVVVNLSNMLLARGPRRAREMALRRSLGATRVRVVRQLLLESLMLAAGGAVVGLAIAWATTRVVASTSAIAIPMLRTVSVDGAALLFGLLATVVAGIAVGVLPALQVAEGGEAAALHSGSRTATSSRRSTRLREGLVVAEIALACVLLVCGGLLLRSFQSLLDVDLGFRPDGLVAWELISSRDFETGAERIAFHDQLLRSIEDIPGVESAGLTDARPLGRNRTWTARREGAGIDESISIFPHIVDPGYVPTMGIPLLAGRMLTPDDDESAEPVVVINESAARAFFPGEEPLLQNIESGGRTWRVVGVVGDVRHDTLEGGAGAEVYFPLAVFNRFGSIGMVVRSSLPVDDLVRRASERIAEADPGMPAGDFTTLEAVVDHAASPRRFILMLVSSFALAALALAALGIYGVLSYSVAERTPEIRIRMALGEEPGSVRRRVIGRTVTLGATGVGIGAVAALLASRWLESLLYDVAPTDPLTFVAGASVLLGVAVLAGLLPAIRASRTDTVAALQAG